MRKFLLTALCPSLMVAACDGGNSSQSPPPSKPGLVTSADARISAASIPVEDVKTQAHDNAVFGFELYAKLAKQDGNLFFSPHSISSALAMAWAGAVGATADAISGTLDFSMPSARVHGAFNGLDGTLASRATAPSDVPVGGTDRTFKLSVVNALWGQQGLAFQAPFLDTLAQNYGTGVRTLDFETAAEPARVTINQWVSDNTNAKIPELLGPGTITTQTRVVLTNAVYFKAGWATAFEKSATANAPFHALDGSTKSVPIMHATLGTGYAEGDGWKAVELPYTNDALALTVIVPDAGAFAQVEGALSADFLAGVDAAEAQKRVAVGLPKFETRTKLSLGGVLTALGMGPAFGPQADFSGIDGAHDLLISDVLHEATITVDEEGTEAAAATAVVIGTSAILPDPITLTIDRPFILVLRDRPTGAVLFLGRIVAP